MKKIQILIILAVMFSTVHLFSADQTALRRFALFIGSNNGGNERQHLLYARKDAETLSQVMTEIGGIAPYDSVLLSDPAKSEVDGAFSSFRERIDAIKSSVKRIEFFLYYSGHSDDEGLLLGEEKYHYSDLRSSINSVHADVHIAILDSCSSGAFTRLKGGTRKSPFLVDESVETSGHAFLTSSSEDEAAQESDSIGGSFFTHYLISALRGAADSSQDSKVTLNEAYSYASDETLARTENSQAGPQHPSYDIKLTGAGELILTDLRATDAVVELDAALDGRLFLRDNEGRLIAEMRKLKGIPMALAIPAGLYSATLQTETRLMQTDLLVRGSYSTRVTPGDFTPLTREGTRSRGNTEYPYYTAGLPTAPPKGIIGGIRSDLYSSLNWDLNTDPADLKHLNNCFSLITPPSMATDSVIHNFGLYLVGTSYRLEGFAIGLAGMQVQNMQGAQMSSVFSITGGDTLGFAGAGIFTITGGNMIGAASSGLFNIAGGDAAFYQGSGLFNVAEGEMTGVQTAGLFNITSDGVSGVQAAGLFNIDNNDTSGVQAAGLFNVSSGHTSGVQASGMLNIAEETSGIQIGTINIAENISGMQVGVINISENMDGLALGLINISSNGLHNLSGWTDDSDYLYFGYQLGAGVSYTVFYGGAPMDGGTTAGLVSGLGLGLHIPLGTLYTDIDLSAKMEVPGEVGTEQAGQFYNYSEEKIIWPSLRACLGIELFGGLAVFGGVTLEGYIPEVTNFSETFHSGSGSTFQLFDSGKDIEIFPKMFFGLRV